MKKIVALILILVVALNAILLLPKLSEESAPEEGRSMIKVPKIEITEVNPGILPNLLKF